MSTRTRFVGRGAHDLVDMVDCTVFAQCLCKLLGWPSLRHCCRTPQPTWLCCCNALLHFRLPTPSESPAQGQLGKGRFVTPSCEWLTVSTRTLCAAWLRTDEHLSVVSDSLCKDDPCLVLTTALELVVRPTLDHRPSLSQGLSWLLVSSCLGVDN